MNNSTFVILDQIPLPSPPYYMMNTLEKHTPSFSFLLEVTKSLLYTLDLKPAHTHMHMDWHEVCASYLVVNYSWRHAFIIYIIA